MGAGDRSELTRAELLVAPAGAEAVTAWLEPQYSAEQMRAIDRWAIEELGIPSLELMERAGEAVAAAVAELGRAGPVRIVCGKGNNGGDGFVAARHLSEREVECEALMLWPEEELSGDARESHARLVGTAAVARVVDSTELPAALEGSTVVVDALLGTGFKGTPRPPLDVGIEAINGASCPIVAVDVPSGADASTGEVAGPCVRAGLTVTFHAAKLGLWIMPAKAYSGRVEVVDIGIPEGGPGDDYDGGLILPAVLGLVPRRSIESTKFSSGSLLVVGGSTGLTGAACLTCEAGMRAGAGWVRAGVPSSLNQIFEQKLTEVMTLPVAGSGGSLEPAALDALLEAAERADSVVLGPGLGRTEGALELARRLASELECPLLLDADGLNAFAGADLGALTRRSKPTVLTPHAGELARLLGTDSAAVSARRLAHVREAARRTGATVVLKGDDSLVAEDGRPVAVSPGGSPALATAGTGDVLSGVIGAFLAKGLSGFDAACAGVYAHTQAGWLAAAEHGADSVIASDVIAALPAALRRPAAP